jgi:hypothetical protein
MSIHMIKLVVGCDTLEDFAEVCKRDMVDYHGQPATPCWTRFMPKRADEILQSEGSIYRVIKNKIQCRLKILGFEMVEVEGKGKMCMIMQSPEIIKTVSKPKRPFQGWRYFEPAKAPADRGLYTMGDDDLDPALEEELKAAGIL